MSTYFNYSYFCLIVLVFVFLCSCFVFLCLCFGVCVCVFFVFLFSIILPIVLRINRSGKNNVVNKLMKGERTWMIGAKNWKKNIKPNWKYLKTEMNVKQPNMNISFCFVFVYLVKWWCIKSSKMTKINWNTKPTMARAKTLRKFR